MMPPTVTALRNRWVLTSSTADADCTGMSNATTSADTTIVSLRTVTSFIGRGGEQVHLSPMKPDPDVVAHPEHLGTPHNTGVR
jgi:hypothetical protein